MTGNTVFVHSPLAHGVNKWQLRRKAFSSSHKRTIRAGSGQGSVAPPDIRKLAQLAQLEITEQQLADWEPKITNIVQWFGELQAVDVTGVLPAIHAGQQSTVLRHDAPLDYVDKSGLLAQVPEVEQLYVKVPRIATGADKPALPGPPTSSSSSPASSHTTAPSISTEALQSLDIRVGRIVSCEQHPEADSLYVEKIDVGEPEPRTIVSGLVKYVPLEQMKDRMVLVICNLKPRNMRGIKSAGMLLAASDDPKTTVEPLQPPAQAKVGERVWFGDHSEQKAPAAPNAMEKKKIWDAVQPLLRTDSSCNATLQGMLMNTSAGPVKSATLAGARIA